jgi:hypothetical protein
MADGGGEALADSPCLIRFMMLLWFLHIHSPSFLRYSIHSFAIIPHSSAILVFLNLTPGES